MFYLYNSHLRRVHYRDKMTAQGAVILHEILITLRAVGEGIIMLKAISLQKASIHQQCSLYKQLFCLFR